MRERTAASSREGRATSIDVCPTIVTSSRPPTGHENRGYSLTHGFGPTTPSQRVGSGEETARVRCWRVWVSGSQTLTRPYYNTSYTPESPTQLMLIDPQLSRHLFPLLFASSESVLQALFP